MLKNCSCCFVLLLQDEPYELVQPSINSVRDFITNAFDNPHEDARILCVAEDETSSVMDRLRSEPDLETLVSTPDDMLGAPPVTDMLATAIRHTPDSAFVVITPGAQLADSGRVPLMRSIEQVLDNYKVLAISHDGKSTRLPQSAVLNQMATQSGVMGTASQGMPITVKKPVFGEVKFERNADFMDFPEMDVPWLIGALAADFQTDRHGSGLRVSFNQWV